MKNYLAYSSQKYLLGVDDMLNLKNSANYMADKDEVVILLGDIEKNIDDTLLAGRDILLKAKDEGLNFIDASPAYYTLNPILGMFVNLIKPLKRKYYFQAKRWYHTPLDSILDKHLMRGHRDASNAYQWNPKRWPISEEDRVKKYSSLYNSLKDEGYKASSPIYVLLNRRLGVQDQLLQGHHRLFICEEVGVKVITVRFWAVPKSPKCLIGINKIINKIKGW